MIFDFAEIPGPECYKLLTATVTPRPIAWVVSLDAAGGLNAAPYSFFNVFSGDPPSSPSASAATARRAARIRSATSAPPASSSSAWSPRPWRGG